MTDALLLREQDRQEILRLLARHLPDVTAWAYGSRVNGGAHEGSDLDIVLRSPDLSPIPLEELRAFVQALRDSNIPILVEARDWARLPESFQREIMKNYVVLRETVSEWRECKLGDILTLQRGHDLPVKDIQEGDFPVAGSNGIIGYHNDFTTEGNGITIGRSGNSIGVSHFYKKRFWAHNTVLYVKKINGAIPKFIYYLLKTFDLKVLNTGSAIPSLNRNHVHMIDVYIPSSIHEQKAIASVLSSLDDKIDLLHRQNKTLEAMAEALFRQWFVEEAGEDWEEITIGETLTVKGGSTPSTKISEYWDGDIHWTTPKDLSKNNSIYLFDTDRKISLKGLSKISSGLLSKGTLLLSSRAPVGYLAFSKVPLAINQGYIAIIDNKDYSKYFIYLWLKLNMEYVKSYSNGSTFQEISKTSFKSLQLLAPPKDKRSKFDEIIKPLFEKIELNADQIRTLEKIRDTLLPKLMSGEVRVAC